MASLARTHARQASCRREVSLGGADAGSQGRGDLGHLQPPLAKLPSSLRRSLRAARLPTRVDARLFGCGDACGLRDGVATLSDWLERGVRFVAVTQMFDFSGTIGQMVAALLFGISQFEQETRRERQSES